MASGCSHLSQVKKIEARTTKHFRSTKHAVMRSFEPGEDWGWCYVDELMIEPAPRA